LEKLIIDCLPQMADLLVRLAQVALPQVVLQQVAL
jgi:hypothetical protein